MPGEGVKDASTEGQRIGIKVLIKQQTGFMEIEAYSGRSVFSYFIISNSRDHGRCEGSLISFSGN